MAQPRAGRTPVVRTVAYWGGILLGLLVVGLIGAIVGALVYGHQAHQVISALEVFSALGGLGTLVAAGAAVSVIFVYKDQVAVGQQQVDASLQQVHQAIEAGYDLRRPVLVPLGSFPVRRSASGVGSELDLQHVEVPITISNIGSGPAFHVRMILLGPKPARLPPEDERYASLKMELLPANASKDIYVRKGFMTSIRGDATIGGEKLYAPDPPADYGQAMIERWYVGRLTITYRDVFGRKHASIFDYTEQQEWNSGTYKFLANLQQDLEDIARQGMIDMHGLNVQR